MNYSPEEIKQIFQAGRYSLIDFSILTNRNYRPNWHHELIANELEKVKNGNAEWKILIVMCPPRSGKSEETTINFPAYLLGNKPTSEIITSSYSEDLAMKFGGRTRDLMDTQEYRAIFPEVKLKEDEQAKGKWRTNKGGSYFSTGIGGGLTGRGADVLIIDDPVKNQEEADSQTIRDKHWDWFISTAYTRLQPNAKVIVTLTRWHLDDLAGRILANPEFSKLTKVISFPAIAEEDEEFRKKGEALWPSMYPIEELESIKRASGTFVFNALYQQRPIISENQEFRKHWFQYDEWENIQHKDTRNFLTIDTAISKKASADYTGIVKNYVDRENKWNIKARHLRLNPKELIDLLFTLNDEDRYEKIGIEKTIYYEAIKPFLDEEMRKRNKFLTIVPLDHKGINKEVRIRGLLPRYESRSIVHIKDECTDLEEEALNFPKGVHDDILDALAYQSQIAEAPLGDLEDQIRMIQNRENRVSGVDFGI